MGVPFKNLKKTLLFLALPVCALTLAQGIYNWITFRTQLEKKTTHILEMQFRTASWMITGEAHEQLVQAYINHDSEIQTRPYYKQIHDVLSHLKSLYTPATQLYTLIRPEWNSDKMLIMSITEKGRSIGTPAPLNSFALNTLETGVFNHSPIYRDRDGTWISVYFPIQTQNKKTVAILGIDYEFHHEVRLQRQLLIRNLAIEFTIGILFSLLIGISYGHPILRSIQKVTETLEKSETAEVSFEKNLDAHAARLAQAIQNLLTKTKGMNQTQTLQTKELERKVHQKTVEARISEQNFQAVLSHFKIGFFRFDRQGVCLSGATACCTEYLGEGIIGKPVGEILKLDPTQAQLWMNGLFGGEYPFEAGNLFAPPQLQCEDQRYIYLKYVPIYDADYKLDAVGVFVSDNTELNQAHLKIKNLQIDLIQMTQIIQDPSRFLTVLNRVKKNFDELNLEFEKSKQHMPQLDDMVRIIFELTQLFSSFSIQRLADASQKLERFISDLFSKDPAEQSSQIPEIQKRTLFLQKDFLTFTQQCQEIFGDWIQNESHATLVSAKNLMSFYQSLTSQPEYQKSFSEKFLHASVGSLFSRFNAFAQKLAQEHKKSLEPLIYQGSQIPVIPFYYSDLFQSLNLVFEFLIEQSIEAPDTRLASAKKTSATISVDFIVVDDRLKITFQDDGLGNKDTKVINQTGFQKLVQKAAELQGTVEIRGEPDRGTSVIVNIQYFA